MKDAQVIGMPSNQERVIFQAAHIRSRQTDFRVRNRFCGGHLYGSR